MDGKNKISNDAILLLILFIVIGSLFLYNKHDVFMSAEADGYFHALGAFFVYDFSKWWITSPTLSFDVIKSFVIDYQVHYKFFGGISYYQPFQSLFVGFLAFFSGKWPLTFYIATALETLGTMLFAYRIYALLYGENRNKLFLFLVPILIALSPAVFNYAASYSLEPGVMLFATMTMFYFIRFMKAGNRKDLYFTAASAGLGILTKSTFVIVLPMLLLSAILERKGRLFLKDYKALVISLAIFLVVISPWLASEYVFANLGISKLGERAIAAMPALEPMIEQRLANAGMTIWVVFGALLIPFFLYKFFRSKTVIGEKTMLAVIILYSLFYNLMANAIPAGIQPRYLTAVIPFAMILSIRGIEILHEQHKRFRPYTLPVIAFILFTSILTTYNFTTLQKNDLAATDILSPAIYIIDNSDSPTTVMSTFSRMQAVAFQVIGDRNISVVEAPFRHSGGEQEAMLMLDSKDYVRRQNKTEWEKFNFTHSPIGWIIIHERYDGGWAEPDYCLKCIIDKRNDFELVEVMKGKWPGNRVFIYRRKASFFS